MEQIDRSIITLYRTLLHGGDKRCNSDASANPDLARLLIFKIKAPVRPFDRYRCTNFQPITQTARMVTQGFGDKCNATLIWVPRRGDGIGVRSFLRVGGYKNELPSGMPRPTLAQRNLAFQHSKL